MIVHYKQDSQVQRCQLAEKCVICWYSLKLLEGNSVATAATDISNNKLKNHGIYSC